MPSEGLTACLSGAKLHQSFFELGTNHGSFLLNLEGKDAEQALLKNKIDAAFLMGDSATPDSMRELMHARGIRLFDFVEGDAYVLRFHYLSKLELPPGSIDLGRKVPPKRLTRLAPTV